MLMLMYKLSYDKDTVDTYQPEMTLRTGPKVKMRVPFTGKKGFDVAHSICVIEYGTNWIVVHNCQIVC